MPVLLLPRLTRRASSCCSLYEEAFKGADITSLVIPESVKTIGARAFERCKSLKTVEILAPLNKLGNEAFMDCTTLKTVTFHAGIKTIEEDVFKNCRTLKAIYVPAKKTEYYKKRLPARLHGRIVELPAEKKSNK